MAIKINTTKKENTVGVCSLATQSALCLQMRNLEFHQEWKDVTFTFNFFLEILVVTLLRVLAQACHKFFKALIALHLSLSLSLLSTAHINSVSNNRKAKITWWSQIQNAHIWERCWVPLKLTQESVCVSVSPLKWKAIISNGIVARVVQLCTKTCNNKVVTPCRMEGNNKITRNQ